MSSLKSKKLLILAIELIMLVLIGCGGTAKLTDKTARELFEMGKKAFDDKQYVRATELFQTIVFNHGGETLVDTAQYYLALSYYSNSDYAVAGVEFNRLATNYPSSVYFENAIYLRAVCFFKGTPGHYGLDQTDLQKAIDQFEDFIVDFPESELVSDAQAFLKVARTRMAKKYYENAVVYRRIGAYLAAQKYYQIVIDDYTESEYGPKAVFENAEVNLKLGKFAEARTGFENFANIFKNDKLVPKAIELAHEAAFKNGVSAFNKGDLTMAKERFETFIKDFPNDDRVNDAKEYLSRIEEKQSLLTEDSHAES